MKGIQLNGGMPLRVTCLVVLAACGGGSEAMPSIDDGRVVFAEVGPSERRDLDLLIVYDDSGASVFTQGWPSIGPLWWLPERWEGRLPNLHYGIVSQDMGIGPFTNLQGCDHSQDGRLQNTPRPTPSGTCEGPTDPYIIDVDDGQGGRTQNFSGTLDETFSCISRLGVAGCGFEQPLAALRRAIDGSQPFNAGFLRPDAALVIVILMDEDDCSVTDPGLFDIDNASLGAVSSYRCFEYGVTCDDGPDDPREIGPRAECHPREDSLYMLPLDEVFDAVIASKGSRADIGLVTAFGDTTPVDVVASSDGDPFLENSCGGITGAAAPGIRLEAFASRFGSRSQVHSACTQTDYAALATGVGSMAQRVLGVPCLTQALILESECTGHLVDYSKVEPTRRTVPGCDAAESNQPCFAIEDDAGCANYPGSLALRYVAASPLASHQRLELRCRPV